MKRIIVLIAVVAGLLATGLTISPVLAQTAEPIVAEVNRQELTTDDVLVFTLRVDSSVRFPDTPQLPLLDGFELLSSSSGSQISIINGVTESYTTYSYQLRPTRTGQLLIPAMGIQVNGIDHQTQPIEIAVIQGNGQPSAPPNGGSMNGLSGFPGLNIPGLGSMPGFGTVPGFPSNLGQPVSPPDQPASVTMEPAPVPADLTGQDYFVDADLDRMAPYQGEQLLYNFRFYQAVDSFDSPQYTPPSFSGFWAQELEERGEYYVEAAGRTYRVTVIQTLLFPTVVGAETIEPASLQMPNSLFTRGQLLRTRPVSLEVQSLPEGAPADFTGAVGQFELNATADLAETTVNETVTQNVVIRGSGNLATMGDPRWSEGVEWRSFESEPEVTGIMETGVWQGERRYSRVLIPTAAGELELPAISFSFFNPASGQYETTSSQAATILVWPDGQADAPAIATGLNAGQVNIPATLERELRPLKPVGALDAGNRSLVDEPLFWSLWLLLPLLIAGQSGWRWWNKRRADTAEARRRDGAGKRAVKRLRQMSNQGERADRIGPIVVEFLSLVLGSSVAGMTRRSLALRLSESGSDPTLVERTLKCLDDSDNARFAPAMSETVDSDLYAEAVVVIEELDRCL